MPSILCIKSLFKAFISIDKIRYIFWNIIFTDQHGKKLFHFQKKTERNSIFNPETMHHFWTKYTFIAALYRNINDWYTVTYIIQSTMTYCGRCLAWSLLHNTPYKSIAYLSWNDNSKIYIYLLFLLFFYICL